MTAVHAELGLAAAAELAARCADHTVDIVSRGPDEAFPSGFADGWAGMAWALTNAGLQYLGKARTALNRMAATLGEPDSPGWCRGFAGRIIAATAAPDDAVRALADAPIRRDLSLCHGELGLAEALIVLAAGGSAAAAAARRTRAALILGAIDRYGPSCGTPGGVSTPGLLTGLAGIGFGLLRLGFPERTPSVLLLRPTQGATGEPHEE
jgi:lantibiotic modifying enzyme